MLAKARAVAQHVLAEAQARDLLGALAGEQRLQAFLAFVQRQALAPSRNRTSKTKNTSSSVRPSSIAACRRLKAGTPSGRSAHSSPSR